MRWIKIRQNHNCSPHGGCGKELIKGSTMLAVTNDCGNYCTTSRYCVPCAIKLLHNLLHEFTEAKDEQRNKANVKVIVMNDIGNIVFQSSFVDFVEEAVSSDHSTGYLDTEQCDVSLSQFVDVVKEKLFDELCLVFPNAKR